MRKILITLLCVLGIASSVIAQPAVPANTTTGVIYLTSINGAFTFGGTVTVPATGCFAFASTTSTTLCGVSTNVVQFVNSTNAQEVRISGTTTGPKYLSLSHNGTNGVIDTAASSGLLSIAPTNATSVSVGKVVSSYNTTGTFTTVTYNVEGLIKRIN